MLLALSALACHKPAPPPPVDPPVVQVSPVALSCSWTWGERGLREGPQGPETLSAFVVNTNGDAIPDLLANLDLCGNHGDCELVVLQGCGDGSYSARWGPEYAQYIEIRGVEGQGVPLRLALGERHANAGCDLPLETPLSWQDDQWVAGETCHWEGLWDAECGPMPGPSCPVPAPEPLDARACDAKMLAGFWKMDVAQAQAQMRDKVSQGYGEIVAFDLAGAKELGSAQCSAQELGYSAPDVAVVQAHLGPEQDAEQALFAGYKSGSLRALARAAGVPAAIAPERVLEEEGFTACDAKQLAEFWGNAQAAATMRDKILAGGTETVASELQLAFENGATAECAWFETGFNTVEIFELSKAWGLTPDRAALRVAKEASFGGAAQLEEQLP